jgi:NADP-dependent 3-hydroxy acid dehydrogenase YdfG
MTRSQSFNLDGKLVLVTGATRGIGRAVAIGAAAAGAELIITGRTTGALEEVDDAIRGAGSTATIVELDMKDYAGNAAPCIGDPRTVGAT